MRQLPRLLVFTAAASMAATGCIGHIKKTNAVPTAGGYQLTAEEQALLKLRLKGADTPGLSLSMSGGGLRSALVNIGVLKALYDDKVLDDVDLVSSVSGGSYVSYWLYGLQSDDPSQGFGAAAFDDGRFMERACEIVAEANFVTHPQMFSKIRHGRRFWSESRDMYLNALKRTFDQRDATGSNGAHGALKMDELAPLVSDYAVPYLVINTTTRYRSPTLADKPATWNERLYEFTPLHFGAFEPTPGRTLWSQSNRGFEMVRAVGASGAALSGLKVMFERPYPGSEPDDVAFLGDGGWSENLGAAAALLRGTRAHIAVDAEYDAAEKLGAWTNLTDKLAASGFALSMDRDPSGPLMGVYRASAVANGASTPIYYVKMEIPRSLRDAIENEARTERARDAHDRMTEILGPMQPTGPGGAREWQCGKLSDADVDVQDLLFHWVASHVKFRDDKNLREVFWKFNPPWLGSFFNHTFPDTTTTDQSKALDEARAYIALGYWTAKGKVAEMLVADGVIEPDPDESHD